MFYFNINTSVFKLKNLTLEERLIFAYINEEFIRQNPRAENLYVFRMSYRQMELDLNIERRNLYKYLDSLSKKKYIQTYIKSYTDKKIKKLGSYLKILNDSYLIETLTSNRIIKELKEKLKK